MFTGKKTQEALKERAKLKQHGETSLQTGEDTNNLIKSCVGERWGNSNLSDTVVGGPGEGPIRITNA